MVFGSLEFIFVFLPLFFLIYFFTPDSRKNLVLLAGSLAFYWYGVKDHPAYLALLPISAAVNYYIGKKIDAQEIPAKRKHWFLVGLIYDLGWLILFKYTGFFLEILGYLLTLTENIPVLPDFHPALPLGISFYTFQIISYLADVYRRKIRAEESFMDLCTWLCMFPHLTSGPIDTYADTKECLKTRVHSLAQVEEGLKLFTIGLGLKVLLANSLGSLWSDLLTIGYDSISTPLAWLGIIGYSLQLYFDFHGYSLMAMGLGAMMGLKLPENFRYPYTACSMTDFWRRWHITLGSWFREYIYIPLGGNRCSASRQTLNMLAVWLLTGLWHGASFNFLLWGGMLFVIMFIEKRGLLKFLDSHSVFAHLYMCFLIPFTWLFFAITDFKELGIYLGRLFPFFGENTGAVFAGDFQKYIGIYGIIFLAGFIFCTDAPGKLYKKYKDHFITVLVLLFVFWACVRCMYLGMDDPFLYYQF